MMKRAGRGHSSFCVNSGVQSVLAVTRRVTQFSGIEMAGSHAVHYNSDSISRASPMPFHRQFLLSSLQLQQV